MGRRKQFKPHNIPLIIMLFVLITIGMVILYSVSGPIAYNNHDRDSMYYVKRQLFFTAFGLLGCFGLANLPLNFFRKAPVWVGSYLASLGLLIVTAVAGKSINGAKRWIGPEAVSFQTSEAVKIGLILALAGYRSYILDLKRQGKLKAPTKRRQILNNFFFEFVVPVCAAGVCDLFIVTQPHLSCALIVAFVVFMCMVASGIRPMSWALGIPSILALLAIVILGISVANPDYFKTNFAHVIKRFEISAALSEDEGEDKKSNVTADDMRQVTNAHNALGSGGPWGVGLGNSRSKYSYVSEAQNDYIFSVYIEETGFAGGLVLIGLYMIFFLLCMSVILRIDKVFPRVLMVGYTSLIMIEILLNLSVNLQVAGLSTGITLPFISYGGTAQVFLMAAYGMILNVARNGVEPKLVNKKESIVNEV